MDLVERKKQPRFHSSIFSHILLYIERREILIFPRMGGRFRHGQFISALLCSCWRNRLSPVQDRIEKKNPETLQDSVKMSLKIVLENRGKYQDSQISKKYWLAGVNPESELGHAHIQINKEHAGRRKRQTGPETPKEFRIHPSPATKQEFAVQKWQNWWYLWFARHDGDAVLTALQLLVADERAHVDRHLDAAILAMLHGHRAHRRPYN